MFLPDVGRRLRRLAQIRHRLQSVDGSAFLVGMGGGLLACGAVGAFQNIYDPSPSTTAMVLGAALAAAALGIYAPHRVAVWFADRLWQRWWSDARDRWVRPMLGAAAGDRPLHLVVVAGMGVVSGAMALFGLALVWGVDRAYAAVLDGFLVGSTALSIIEWNVVAAVAGLLFIPVGATWSSLHHVSVRPGGWTARPVAGGLVGLGAAIIAAEGLAGNRRPDLLLMLASVPFFVLSIFVVRFSPVERVATVSQPERKRVVPRVGDRRGALIGTCLVLAFASSAASAAVWERVFEILGAGSVIGGALVLSAWLFGLAAGIATCRRHSGSGRDPEGSVGLMWVGSGLAGAAAVGLLGLSGSLGVQWCGSWVVRLTAAALLVGLPALATGRGVGRGIQAVLARAGDASGTGAALLSWMTLAAGLIALLAAGLLVASIGTHATLVAASLTFIGVGGALIIHEPVPCPRHRTLRLAGVFVSIALVSALLPCTGDRWLKSRPWKRLVLAEGSWLTRSVWAVRGEIRRMAEPPSSDSLMETLDADLLEVEAGLPVDWGRLPPSARVAVVGDSLSTGIGDLPGSLATWDRLRFDPVVRSPIEGWPSASKGKAAVHEESAVRFLRRTHRRYDLVIVNAGDVPRSLRLGRAGAKLLRNALDHLTADGVLILLAPTADSSLAGLAAWLQRGGFGREADYAWSAATFASEPCLVFACGREPGWRDRWSQWSAHATRDPAELLAILAAGERRRHAAAFSGPEGFVSAQESP